MKEILIIGAGLLMVPTVKVAKSMGLKVTLVDQNQNAPAVPYSDGLIVASTYDPERIISEIRDKGWKDRFDGVFTAGADVEVTVAEVASALNLPGIPPIVARRCNDKFLMKESLYRNGVKTPWATLVNKVEDVLSVVEEIGLPVVVKPIRNCGSRGVSYVNDDKKILQAYEDALRFSEDGKVVVEAFLEGTTHTVEMIALNGTYYLASIIDTVHGFLPYFVELYHVNPTRRSVEDREKMLKLAKDAARTLGIEHGVAKVDIIFAEDGPQVMEITARLSGGFHCQYTTPLACGTNNIRAAIRIALGEEPDLNDIIPQKNECAICKALFPEPGVIKAIKGVNEARNIEGIADIFILKKEGDVVGPYRNASDRPVYIIAHGKNEETVWKGLKEAEERISIETE